MTDFCLEEWQHYSKHPNTHMISRAWISIIRCRQLWSLVGSSNCCVRSTIGRIVSNLTPAVQRHCIATKSSHKFLKDDFPYTNVFLSSYKALLPFILTSLRKPSPAPYHYILPLATQVATRPHRQHFKASHRAQRRLNHHSTPEWRTITAST